MSGQVQPHDDTVGLTPATQYSQLASLAWEDIVPGVRAQVVWEGPDGWPRIAIVRMDPGATVPRHRHTGREIVVVLQGGIADEYGEGRSGWLAERPKGCTHSLRSPDGVLMVAVAHGPIDFVPETR